MTFGWLFDQSLDNATLPSGLQALTFGEDFDQRLGNTTLPSGLKHLTVDEAFDLDDLVDVIFPAGCRVWQAHRGGDRVEVHTHVIE